MLKRNPHDRINFEDFSTHAFLNNSEQPDTLQNFPNSYEPSSYLEQHQLQIQLIQQQQQQQQQYLTNPNRKKTSSRSTTINDGPPNLDLKKKPTKQPTEEIIGAGSSTSSKQLSESPVSVGEVTKQVEKNFTLKDQQQNQQQQNQQQQIQQQQQQQQTADEKDLNDYVLINRPTKLSEPFNSRLIQRETPVEQNNRINSSSSGGGMASKANSDNNLDLIPVPTQVENYRIMEKKFSRTPTTPTPILGAVAASGVQTPQRITEISLSDMPIIHKFKSNPLNFTPLDIGLDVVNTPRTNQMFVDELEEETILDVNSHFFNFSKTKCMGVCPIDEDLEKNFNFQ